MKNRKLAIWLTIVSFFTTLMVNFLATNLPLNNLTTGEISDSFNIYFVPAGYVFSIWGLIYLGLIAYVVFQALPSQRENPVLAKIDTWFIVSNFANAMWLVSWHYQRFTWSVVVMLVILICLIGIFLNLEIGRRKSRRSFLWIVEIPFSIYLGWISVATIANVTQLLYFLEWDGLGIAPQIWLVIMLAAAVVISALMSFTRRNIPHAFVLIWSFVGIAIKFPDVPLVNLAAWIAAGGVGVLLVIALLTQPKLSAG